MFVVLVVIEEIISGCTMSRLLSSNKEVIVIFEMSEYDGTI